jgi:hypothetical protein
MIFFQNLDLWSWIIFLVSMFWFAVIAFLVILYFLTHQHQGPHDD